MSSNIRENAVGGAQKGWRATKPEKIEEAEALLATGASLGAVAHETGLSKATIHRLRKGSRPKTTAVAVREPGIVNAYPPREAVMAKTGGRCWYCGRDAEHDPVDHVVPRCDGGSNELCNLVPCCLRCNSTKTRLGLEEFRELMAMYAAKWPYFSRAQRGWLKSQNFVPPAYVFYGERHVSCSPG